MKPVNSHIAGAYGQLDCHRNTSDAAFESTRRVARDLLHADAIDVLFIDSPNESIPELGVGGYSCGPHVNVVAIDLDFPNLSDQHLLSTLVHEFHRAKRWRSKGLKGNLGEMIVSEGVARIFEEEVSGVRAIYSQVFTSSSDIELASLALHLGTFSQAKWFFGTENITKWFGDTWGYQICAAFSISAGKSASDLVEVSTRDVLEAAGFR